MRPLSTRDKLSLSAWFETPEPGLRKLLDHINATETAREAKPSVQAGIKRATVRCMSCLEAQTSLAFHKGHSMCPIRQGDAVSDKTGRLQPALERSGPSRGSARTSNMSGSFHFHRPHAPKQLSSRPVWALRVEEGALERSDLS